MKRVYGGLIILALVAVTGLLAKKSRKPYVETAPAYRIEGSADAPITISEFSDFECPACRAAEGPRKQLLALYGSKVRFIFKDFPLEHIHPWAKTAAIAAECVGEQGKFWEFHDLLYENQDKWVEAKSPPDAIEGYVKSLGLDNAAFKACLKDPKTVALIDADVKEGQERWVSATPTFFINGKRFIGGLQLSALGPIWIDKILAQKHG